MDILITGLSDKEVHDLLRYKIGLELIRADKYEKGELSRQRKDLCKVSCYGSRNMACLKGACKEARVAAAPGVRGREQWEMRPKRGQSDAVHTLWAVLDI